MRTECVITYQKSMFDEADSSLTVLRSSRYESDRVMVAQDTSLFTVASSTRKGFESTTSLMNQIRHHLRPVPLSWVFDVLTTTRGASKRLLSPCKYQERFVAIHILCFTWLDDVQAHYLFVRIVEVLKTKNMGSHLTSSNVRECNLQRQSLVVEPVAARVREWYVDLVYQ